MSRPDPSPLADQDLEATRHPEGPAQGDIPHGSEPSVSDSVFDAVVDGLVINDFDGGMVAANAAMCRMHGYTREEFLRQDPRQFIHPDDHHLFVEYLKSASAGQPFRCMARDICKDGSVIDVEVHGSVITYRGQPHVLGVVRDITEQRRVEAKLRESEARYARRNKVLEQLATGASLEAVLTTLVEEVEAVQPDMIGSVLRLDDDQRLRHGAAPSLPESYNRAVDGLPIGPREGSCGTAAYLGQRVVVEDVLKHPYWVDYRELAAKANVRACWSEPVRSSQGEILGTFAMYYREPRGPQEADLQLIRSSAHLAAIAIEHKRAEERLLQAHAELEKRVEQRTREIALANEALKQSNQDLQNFAYVASHDMQEPLRMVTSYCQLLQNRYQGKLDRDADDFLHFAVDGATRMQDLISDLLTYSRLDRNPKFPAPTDCNLIMDTVVRHLDTCIQATGATVIYEGLPTVVADAVQLTQVFQNLVENGIKYHGEQAPRVEVTVAEVGDEWQFAVRDNGIGIDPAYAEQIFAVFKRLHNREDYGGTGLGLAICKRAVSRHGGRIWVESQPGEGSVFYFTLPIAPVAG